MEGIEEMFAELSQPDEFVSQYQLELFAWHEKQSTRRRFKPLMRKYRREHMARARLDPAKLDAIRARVRAAMTAKRRAMGVKPLKRTSKAERREQQRQWVANKRAAERQARAA